MTIPCSVNKTALIREGQIREKGNYYRINIIDSYSLIRFNTGCSSFKYKLIEVISIIQTQQKFLFKSLLCSEKTVQLVIPFNLLDSFLSTLKTHQMERIMTINVTRKTSIIEIFEQGWTVQSRQNLLTLIKSYNLKSDIIPIENSDNSYSILITNPLPSELMIKLNFKNADL
ncbi:MAG: hypothetical protein ACP5FK_12155 [bacterium]